VCLLAGGLVAWLAWQSPVISQDAPRVHDFASLFSIGGLLNDSNGDGVADGLSASFLLGDTPSADEVAAAAEIAARLGFETSALSLPVARDAGPAVIVIGQTGLTRLKLDVRSLELPRLSAGEGLVRVATLEGTRYVIVLGGDGAGLRAAARTLASRVPHVSSLDGATYAQVESDVERLLDAAKVPGATVEVPEFHVKAAADGLEQVVVVVRLSSLRDMTGAMFALQRVQMDRDRSAGQARSVALSYTGVRTVSIRLGGPDSPSVNIDVPRAAASTTAAAAPTAWPAHATDRLDLSTLFTADGLLADTDGNLVPDAPDAAISPAGEGAERTIDLAARLGLESTGLVVPLMRPADLDQPAEEPTLVIVGTTHPLLDRLIESKKFKPPTLDAGEGLVHVVRDAFGDRPAVLVTGADAPGLDRALEQLAERLPRVWDLGTDRTSLDDIENDVQRFANGRTPAGQAAAALSITEQIIGRLAGTTLTSLDVSLALDAPDESLQRHLQALVQDRVTAGTITTSVHALDLAHAAPILVDGKPFDHELSLASEVDEFWQVFNTKVLKAAKRGKPLHIEARLSEPATVRAKIAADVRAQLIKKGLKESEISVSVLSAYKQGYSWLVEDVLPALAGKAVDRLVVSVADGAPTPSQAHVSAGGADWWLSDLQPADEVLARDLELPLPNVIIERRPGTGAVYRVVATNAAGDTVLERTFDPKREWRPWLTRFPDYDLAPVATGWIVATSDRRTLVDQRIATDIERFWDQFQSRTLEGLHDYAVALHDGRPRSEGRPIWGTLTVDVTLSEPDEPVGIGLERLAPLEALHEEVFTATRRFFERVGGAAGVRTLPVAGRIVPIVRPTQDGRPGKAVVSATGFVAPRPRIVARYTTSDGAPKSLVVELPVLAAERPSATTLLVKAGESGIARLGLTLAVDGETDDPLALTPRPATTAGVLSADRLTSMFTHLGSLRAAGLYPSELAYHGLGDLDVEMIWAGDNATHRRSTTLRANGAPRAWPSATTTTDSRAAAPPSTTRVPLKAALSPADVARVMAGLAADFKEVTLYSIGRSLLGREVWAMDLTSPVVATHMSRAKASTFKPTIIYSARERGSERASTSHVLRLAETLLSDAQLRPTLDKVNVVFHPMANPDGAELAATLGELTPSYLLHASAFGAQGDDIGAWAWEGEQRVPEMGHRPLLWRLWQPDVMVTARGGPSHHVTRLFSTDADDEFQQDTPWPQARAWFMPQFSFLDDPRFPWHKTAARAIRDRVSARLSRLSTIEPLLARARARSARASAFTDSDATSGDASLELVAPPSRGFRSNNGAADVVARHPRTTYWNGRAGAPDEGAVGDALEVAAAAGLEFDLALLEWIAEQPRAVERQERVTTRGVWLQWHRGRPPRVPHAPGSAAPTTSVQPH
jgi:hypothetical protein